MNQESGNICPCEVFPANQLSEAPQQQNVWPNRRRIYMSFVRDKERWHCRFHRDDLGKTPFSKEFVFRSAEKIYEAARRGDGLPSLEAYLELDRALSLGRGGLWLHLTEEQHSVLTKARSRQKQSDPHASAVSRI
jgi:hypothetical protein